VKTWSEWEITRRQVAIGGRVCDHGNRPIAGAEVTITTMPEAFQRKIAAQVDSAAAQISALDRRLDRKHAEPDGIYYFLDLPAGEYTVRAADPRSRLAAEKTVAVSWSQDGKIQIAVADLKLSNGRRGT
jgi:hypothetical protein